MLSQKNQAVDTWTLLQVSVTNASPATKGRATIGAALLAVRVHVFVMPFENNGANIHNLVALFDYVEF